MAGKNREKWNPGSVVNWGQVEMIYDLRNVLTLDTIIRTTVSTGLSNLWNQIKIGIFPKMRNSTGKTWGKRQRSGQMRPYLICKARHLLFPHCQSVNLQVLIYHDSEERCCQEWVYAKKTSSVWNLTGGKKTKKSLEISEEGGICPSYSVSVFTQLAHVSKLGSLKNSVKHFSITQEPWAWSQVSGLRSVTRAPKQQEPSAGSPVPFAYILNQHFCFLCGLYKRITEELLYFQVQDTLTHFRS